MTTLANNLPLQLTSFIGREREIIEIKRLLVPPPQPSPVSDRGGSHSARLLTLTGSGGAGKTRLALQVAAEVSDSFPNGVWFIDLAPLSDSTLVPQTVATVFGLQEQGGRPIANALRDYLREKHLLLILDNCEHLIDACARFADDVLRNSPQVSILATSREALSIAGESSFRVPSLSLPDLSPATIRVFEQSEAIQLFNARATAAYHDFKLTNANASTVAQICQRLDGMPLAIELAAVRVKVLSVNEIAARLNDRFNLLTLGSRTAPTRQQTLRGAIDWSYDLLSEQERTLLKRLSVFAGGWTLEAVEQVCSEHVLDVLTRLADKSLVIAEEHNTQTRYRMLETIRQYAREKLIELGELNTIRDRHLNYFVEWAEMAEPQLHSPEQLSWLNRLETENDNLRAALEWSIENKNTRAEAGMRLAGSLKWFWYFSGHWGEGCDWLDRILASSNPVSSVPKAVRAKALDGAGWLNVWNHNSERSVAVSEESLSLYRELGDSRGMGIALFSLANAALYREDYSQAVMQGEASAALLSKAGDQVNLHWTLSILAHTAMNRGDYAKAIQLWEQCLALTRAIGAHISITDVILDLSSVYESQGNYAEATRLGEEGLIRAREVNSKLYLALALTLLGQAAFHQEQYDQVAVLCEEGLSYFRAVGSGSANWSLDILGLAASRTCEYARAETLFKEALRANTRMNYKQGIAENLAGLSAVLAGLGQLESSARLCGAAEALLESVGANLGPADREEYHRTVSALLAQLYQSTFDKLWTEGRALTKEQAIDYVSSLQFTRVETAQSPLLPHQKTQEALGGLTPRERQVAVLIARGKSNRDIASELVLSERTVEHHVGNILSKLELHSRSQLAAWVVEKGLYKK